jgi:site-specific DNA recombinase
MADLQNRKDAPLKQLEVADEPPPLLHPSMADFYRSRVEELASALQREDTRLEASEILRGLIDSIVLTTERGQLRIELRGNLGAMIPLRLVSQGLRTGSTTRFAHGNRAPCVRP